MKHFYLNERYSIQSACLGLHRSYLVLIAVSLCCLLCMTAAVPSMAGEYDWAIPSGPLPDPPDPGDPVCAYCHGAGCSVCQPDMDDDYFTDPEPVVVPQPDPAPAPTNGVPIQPPAPPPAAPAPVTPIPAVNQQQLFEREKEALLKEFAMPAGLMEETLSPSMSASPIKDDFGLGSVPMGLSDSEWREAAECQQRLDVLYEKWPLNSTEIAELDELVARRNTLWKKAISVPGLTAWERERLRLKLHTLNTQPDTVIPAMSREAVDKWLIPPSLSALEQSKPAVPTMNPVSSWLVGQFALGQVQSSVELGGEVWADQIIGEHSFGDFLGVGKIALAYKEGGVSSALAEAGNYLVGKIPIPQANIAVEGGRQYANVVYQAQNKFMTDAMKAAGGEFDKEKFWSDFNDDLTLVQRAVKEWIGYGKE